jgi:hypothetical protein
MRSFRSRNTAKDWARLAAKLGLLITDPKIRAAIADQFRDGMDHVTDTVASKYEDAVERLEAAGDAFRGSRKSYWSEVGGFLLGVGVGAGLGILLAPAPGSETREAIRDKAVDMKNRVVDSAATATGRARQSVRSMPSTGTEG